MLSVSLKQCDTRAENDSDFIKSVFIVRRRKNPLTFAHKANYFGYRLYEHYKYERYDQSFIGLSITRKESKKNKSKGHMRLVKKLYKLCTKRGPTDTSQNAYRRCNLHLLLHN